MNEKLVEIENISKHIMDNWIKKNENVYFIRNQKIDYYDIIRIKNELYEVLDIKINFDYTEVYLQFKWRITNEI